MAASRLRGRREILTVPAGEKARLVVEYHRFRKRRDTHGMLAVEVESVLDGPFEHVNEFLAYYRDVEWGGWLANVTWQEDYGA